MRKLLIAVASTFENFDYDDHNFATKLWERDLKKKMRCLRGLVLIWVNNLKLCLLSELLVRSGEPLKLNLGIKDSRGCLYLKLKMNENASCIILRELAIIDVFWLEARGSREIYP